MTEGGSKQQHGDQNFGEMTTIHGIHDISSAKSIYTALLWTFVFIGCLIAFALQATTLTIDFRSEPISSYVQSEFPTQFPSMIVCPDNYQFSLEKLKYRPAYEISADKLTEIAQKYYEGNVTVLEERLKQVSNESGLEYGKIFSLWFLKSLHLYGFYQNLIQKIMDADHDRFFLASVMNKVKDDVKDHFWNNFVRQNETIAELEFDLALDFKDFVVPYEYLGLGFEYSYNLMTAHGVCYAFKFDQLVLPLMSNAQLVMAQLINDSTKGFFDWTVTSARGSKLGVGYFLTFSEPSFLPSNPYMVFPYLEDHFVEISMTRVKRENLRRRPCRYWSQHHYASCVVACYNRVYCNNPDKRKINGSRACPLWHPYITREEEHGNLCNWWDGEGSVAREVETDEQFHCLAEPEMRKKPDVQLECTAECPLVCTELVYYATIVRSTEARDTTVITMKFHKPNSEFLIEERQEFTSVSFVSNLGGTLSLWIGASFLSLIQTTCYFTNKIAKRCAEKKRGQLGR